MLSTKGTSLLYDFLDLKKLMPSYQKVDSGSHFLFYVEITHHLDDKMVTRVMKFYINCI